MALPEGSYRIKITRQGYKTMDDHLKLSSTSSQFNFDLERDCRTVQVPKKECKTVTRYRRTTEKQPVSRRVSKSYKLGPHLGLTDTACREGRSKVQRLLEDKCRYNEDLKKVRSRCKGCDAIYCYTEATGTCVGEKRHTERTPYEDRECKQVLVNERQCVPL